MEFVLNTISTNSTFSIFPLYKNYIIPPSCTITGYSNMTSFKRFESKPVIKIILIYDRLNLWRHRQFIMIFYQFLHIRIEIIHGSHIYILFLPRVGLYVSFLPLANARGKTSWRKGLPVVKTIYTYGFHELFLKLSSRYVFSCVIYFRFIHFILISTAHALFWTFLSVSIYGT
jgi:hypothetical protein